MADLTQRVVWTVLPNGVTEAGDRLRLSVLVSPRLTLSNAVPTHNLSHFKDWLDWPKVVLAASFKLRVDAGGVEATRVSKPDSDVWAALFSPETFVQPFAFRDLRKKVLLSYPVAGLAQTIHDLYGDLAVRATDDLPTTRAGFQRWFTLRDRPDTRSVLKMLRTGGFDELATTATGQLALLETYHRPLEQELQAEYKKKDALDPREDAKWRTHAVAPLPKPEDYKKLIDFHQVVASLGQYSELLRLCGLVIDLEAPRAGIGDGDHSLQLDVGWPKADPAVQTDPDVLPVTQVRLSGKSFFVRRRVPGTPVVDRFLNLQKSGYDLVQVDVDGGGLKVKNFAVSLPRIARTVYDDDSFGDEKQATAGAPSLRSAGLMLAQQGRAKAIKGLFDGSGGLQDKLAQNQPLAPLFIEDVVRGYRIDVREESGRWRSLCRRDGEYVFVHTGTVRRSADEEGVIRLAAGSSADGTNPDIMKVHEGLFAWKGWSLCAPEPGRVVMPDDSVGEAPNAAPDGLPLETHFTPVKRSLPSLRFGRRYAVRARLVDLAGESTPFSEGDIQPAEAVSTSVVYRR